MCADSDLVLPPRPRSMSGKCSRAKLRANVDGSILQSLDLSRVFLFFFMGLIVFASRNQGKKRKKLFTQYDIRVAVAYTAGAIGNHQQIQLWGELFSSLCSTWQHVAVPHRQSDNIDVAGGRGDF